MSPKQTVNLLSVLFLTFCTFAGSVITLEIGGDPWSGTAAGAVFALLIILADRLLRGFSLRAFSSATFGLFLGIVFATLLRASGVLQFQSEGVQWVVGLALYLAFGYLGMMLAMRSNRDEFALIIPYVRFTREAVLDAPLVLDTNIVIDGRIADLCSTGFLSRQLIVPRLVLNELQHLSDSPDPIRRARGRRGLDNLNALQGDKTISLSIHEHDNNIENTPDATLIRIAQLLQARIVSNDQALAKLARLRGLPVLNLNDLVKALRPAIVPGDELDLDIVREGRDSHQGVGYLPDGTMIVVNNASQHVGQTIAVVVAGAMQTSAGRLFFAELRGNRTHQG